MGAGRGWGLAKHRRGWAPEVSFSPFCPWVSKLCTSFLCFFVLLQRMVLLDRLALAASVKRAVVQLKVGFGNFL